MSIKNVLQGIALVIAAAPMLAGSRRCSVKAGEEEKEPVKRIEIFDPHDRAVQRLLNRCFPEGEEIPEGFSIKRITEITVSVHEHRGDDSGHRRVERVTLLAVINEEGEKDGTAVYDPGGSSQRRVRYKNGVRHGYEEIFRRTRDVGLYVQEKRSWENGRLHGTRTRYHPDGSIQMTGSIVDGEPHGESRTYCPGGKLTETVNYKEGRMHGERVLYWVGSDTVRRVIIYEMGTVEGMVRDYHSNGKIRRKLPYRRGTMHGIEKHFDEEGAQVRERFWLNDELVPRGRFDMEYEDDPESQ